MIRGARCNNLPFTFKELCWHVPDCWNPRNFTEVAETWFLARFTFYHLAYNYLTYVLSSCYFFLTRSNYHDTINVTDQHEFLWNKEVIKDPVIGLQSWCIHEVRQSKYVTHLQRANYRCWSLKTAIYMKAFTSPKLRCQQIWSPVRTLFLAGRWRPSSLDRESELWPLFFL